MNDARVPNCKVCSKKLSRPNLILCQNIRRGFAENTKRVRKTGIRLWRRYLPAVKLHLLNLVYVIPPKWKPCLSIHCLHILLRLWVNNMDLISIHIYKTCPKNKKTAIFIMERTVFDKRVVLHDSVNLLSVFYLNTQHAFIIENKTFFLCFVFRFLCYDQTNEFHKPSSNFHTWSLGNLYFRHLNSFRCFFSFLCSESCLMLHYRFFFVLLINYFSSFETF